VRTLTPIVSAHRKNTPYNKGDDLIFTNRIGTWIDYHNITNRVFNQALDQAGLRRIRFHDLRHTYAALCISENVNFKWLQRQMGHASITTTMDTYGHIAPEVEEGLGGKLDSLLFDENVVPFKKKASGKG
jgi:integrase